MTNIDASTVVITGGAGGIGLAMAHAFGAEGASLVLADLHRGRLNAAVADLEARGIPVLGVETDVTDRRSVEELAAATVERFGGVDVICNNAGVATWGPIESTTPADWEYVMGVNFHGVVNGVDAFLPHLLQQGGGHIVNTASMAGLVGMSHMAVYCASKFAVVGFSESIARELAPKGIGVTVVCPMVVDTPINERSVAMRPDHLRNDAEVAEPDDGALAGSVIDAASVADRVVEAVRSNRLYVLTHPEQQPILARRSARLEAAAADLL